MVPYADFDRAVSDTITYRRGDYIGGTSGVINK